MVEAPAAACDGVCRHGSVIGLPAAASMRLCFDSGVDNPVAIARMWLAVLGLSGALR